MTKGQRAKELAKSLLDASIPLYVALVMSIGAAALGIVSGPPIIALASPSKAAELVGSHCNAVLANAHLECERELNKRNSDFTAKIDQLRGEHMRELESLRLIMADQSREIAALKKDVCILQAGLDSKPASGCLE